MNNTWKVKDIAGFKVLTADQKFLGLLFDVLPTGSNDVFVIRNEEKELLIPALKSVVKEINEMEKVIIVNLPQGLEDVYQSHQSAKP